VKLTPVIGANPYRRDIQTLIHRTEPSRPHISSDICDVKEREGNQNRAPYRPARRLVPFGISFPPPHLCAAGEGPSTDSHRDPQALFSRNLRDAG
jgi:hypothetical protein